MPEQSKDSGDSKRTMTADEFCRWVESLGQHERDEVDMAANHAIWSAEDDEGFPDDTPVSELRALIHDRHEQLHDRMSKEPGRDGVGGPTQRDELLSGLLASGMIAPGYTRVIVDQLIAPLVWEVADAVFDARDLTQMMAELGWQPIPGSGR